MLRNVKTLQYGDTMTYIINPQSLREKFDDTVIRARLNVHPIVQSQPKMQ